MRIRTKLFTAFIVLSAIMMTSVGFIGYTSVKSIERSTGNHIRSIAQTTKASFKVKMDSEHINTLKISQNPEIIRQVNRSNKNFSELENISETLKDRDSQWRNGDKKIIKDVLQSNISQEILTDLLSLKSSLNYSQVNEIIVTNRYGAVVGASKNLTDYDQSDENWWITAYNQEPLVGEIRYDKSLNSTSIFFSLPIVSGNKVVGVAANSIPLEDFFKPVVDSLKDTDVGNYTQFIVVSDNGTVYYDSTTVAHLRDVSKESFFKDIIRSKERFVISESRLNPGIQEIYGISRPEFRGEDKDWFIVIGQDLRGREENPFLESFSGNIDRIVMISFFTFIYSVIAAVILAETISRPLVELKNVLQSISKGDFSYNIHKGLKNRDDEIGELARAFDRLLTSFKIMIRKEKFETFEEE